MACTIDHLRSGVRAEVIKDFTDAWGVSHRRGENGILRKLELDWARQEIVIEWERTGRSETLHFKLSAKEGPRNGVMRHAGRVQRVGSVAAAPRSHGRSPGEVY